MLPYEFIIMKTELLTLTSCVGMLIAARPIYIGTDMLDALKTESVRLKIIFRTSIEHATDSFKLTETMNSHYIQLVALANDLWERAKIPNPIARRAMMEVLSLKDLLECEYGNFLDEFRIITNFERFKLENKVLSELIIIKEQLRFKKIGEEMILQLEKVFLDLFKESKCFVFSALNKDYVNVLLAGLSLIANDKRDKDWNVRLRQLLIKYNCNHRGIFMLLEAEHKHQILLVKDAEMQEDLLHDKEMWIEQIQSDKVFAYNRSGNDLKSMLLKHITAMRPHLAKKHKIRRTEKQEKVKYKLSVDELSLVYHYHWEEKIYDYPSKRAAAKAFCEHNRSMGTADISVNSFLKFDKLEQQNAALKLYQRITRIQNKLKGDFDI